MKSSSDCDVNTNAPRLGSKQRLLAELTCSYSTQQLHVVFWKLRKSPRVEAEGKKTENILTIRFEPVSAESEMVDNQEGGKHRQREEMKSKI